MSAKIITLKTTENNETKLSYPQTLAKAVYDDNGTSLGSVMGYQYMGVATPSTDPGTPDNKVYYIATESGTYSDFGGLTVAEGEVAILKYNGTAWSKDITGAATENEVSQLGQEVSRIQYTIETSQFDSSASFDTNVFAKSGDKVIINVSAISGLFVLFTKGHSDTVYVSMESAGTYEATVQFDGILRIYMASSGSIKGTLNVESRIDLLEAATDSIETKVNGATITPSSPSFTAKYDTSGTTVAETSPNPSVVQKIVEVYAGQIITIYGYGASAYRLWALTDNLGNIIDKSASMVDATTTPIIITVPNGVTKLYASCYAGYTSSFNITVKTLPLEQVVINKTNILFNKKLYFIGDSVMIGQPTVDAVKNITSFIQDDFGCECHNNAVGGSVIVYPWYTGNAYSIYYQLSQIPNDADYIIIQGGLNGVNMDDPTQPNYAPMGEISSSFTDNFDKTTQIGCLEAICKYLYDNFPSKKYGFIMNYEIGSYDYWRGKAELFMPVLKKWSIPVLDWRESGISLASLPQYSKYGIDSYSLYPQYDENEGYSVDDKVIYNTYTYKANEEISAPAGAFDSTKWTLISTQRYDTWHCNRLAYEKLAYITAKWMEKL